MKFGLVAQQFSLGAQQLKPLQREAHTLATARESVHAAVKTQKT